VVGHTAIVERLESYVESRNVPNMMFAGRAGVGKTTCAHAIANELYGDDKGDFFAELNASDERGIDVVRDKVKNFARSIHGKHDYKIIFLDEADALCLPPRTEVVVGYPSSPELKPIEEVDEEGEPMPSVDFETNEVKSDKGRLVDSGVADFFELELGDGRTVTASLNHPFFTVGDDGRLVEKRLRELEVGDEIADFETELGVEPCEVCGERTVGRFCSVGCKNEGHSRGMQGDGNPMYGTEWSEERREKILAKLTDGRLSENNPNHDGDFHGTSAWEVDEDTVEGFKERLNDLRSGTSWKEWVVEADAEEVKERIGERASEWWGSLDEDEKRELVERQRSEIDYPVCDITGDENPIRDPGVAQKVSEALKGHEPTGGYPHNARYEEELGHVVRSGWEYDVARALRDAGIEYEYNPEFELSDGCYFPDFLVGDTVIEVKGSVDMWGRVEKVEEFLTEYGDEYRLIVVGDGSLPHDEHFSKDGFEPEVALDGGVKEVSTAEVIGIEYSHRGKAYNITMEGTPNFSLANGILTHNTRDAQPALRRTMEEYTNTCRFILSCNYSSNIIDPIQSRCTVFRFSPVDDEAVVERLRFIADKEGVEVTDDGFDALAYVAQGDVRRAVNALQAAAALGETVDDEAVYATTSTARAEEVEELLTLALGGDFAGARGILEDLLDGKGISGGDLIDQMHRTVTDIDIEDAKQADMMDSIGETDYRVSTGADERIQIEAFLASLATEAE